MRRRCELNNDPSEFAIENNLHFVVAVVFSKQFEKVSL